MVATNIRIKRGFAETPAGYIDYREAGSGPPLIMLHPTARSSRLFVPVIPHLAAGGIRAIGMSTMGFGESDRPDPPFDNLRQFAQTVVWLMDGLGLEKASVFGTHTGSQIALATAAEFPDRVDKLILEEVFNWNTPARRAIHERIHRYYPEKEDGSHLVELWKRHRGLAPEVDLRKVTEGFLDNLKVNSDEGCAEIYGPTGWEGSATHAMCKYETWEAAAKIKAPTLLIHGSESELGGANPKLQELIPRSKGVRPPTKARPDGAGGHFQCASNPEYFAKIVLEFLGNPGV